MINRIDCRADPQFVDHDPTRGHSELTPEPQLIFVAVSDVAELGEARAMAAPPHGPVQDADRWRQHGKYPLRQVGGRAVEQPG